MAIQHTLCNTLCLVSDPYHYNLNLISPAKNLTFHIFFVLFLSINTYILSIHHKHSYSLTNIIDFVHDGIWDLVFQLFWTFTQQFVLGSCISKSGLRFCAIQGLLAQLKDLSLYVLRRVIWFLAAEIPVGIIKKDQIIIIK